MLLSQGKSFFQRCLTLGLVVWGSSETVVSFTFLTTSHRVRKEALLMFGIGRARGGKPLMNDKITLIVVSDFTALNDLITTSGNNQSKLHNFFDASLTTKRLRKLIETAQT